MNEINVLWYYLIGFIIIWVLAFLFQDKLKIDVTGPLLMRRTKRLRGFIDSVANKSPRFWRWGTNIGLPVSVFFMILMVYFLLISFQSVIISLFQTPQVAQVSLIVPGVDIPGSSFYVPLGYGIVALMTVLVVHEFGHGILARVEGVKIKSIGVLLLAIIPGAFVEPDEDDVEKSKRISKLRIYAAGSVFNLGLALIALILSVFIMAMIIGGPFGLPSFNIPGTNVKTPSLMYNSTEPVFPTFHTDGEVITSVVPGGPSAGILKEGMVIQSINGVSTSNSTNYLQILSNSKIGDNLTFQTNQGTYNVVTGSNPNNHTSYVGLRSTDNLVVNTNVKKTFGTVIPWFLFMLSQLFYWIFLLNFAIGTVNLLPMKPLDGGLILEELLGYKLSESMVNKIVIPLSYFLIMILVVSIVYGLGRGISLLF